MSQGRADSGKHLEEERMEVNVSLTYESVRPTVCCVIISSVSIDVDLLPSVCVQVCVCLILVVLGLFFCMCDDFVRLWIVILFPVSV